MTDTLSIADNQTVTIGLALENNPNNLTIASAVWSWAALEGGTLTPAEDTLTAVYVAGGSSDDNTDFVIDVTATLSDGSTIEGSGTIDVTAPALPLTLILVFGTPS